MDPLAKPSRRRPASRQSERLSHDPDWGVPDLDTWDLPDHLSHEEGLHALGQEGWTPNSRLEFDE